MGDFEDPKPRQSSRQQTSSRLRALELTAPRGNPDLPPPAFLFTNVVQQGLEYRVLSIVLERIWAHLSNTRRVSRSLTEEVIAEVNREYAIIRKGLGFLLRISGDDTVARDRRHTEYHRQHATYLILEGLSTISTQNDQNDGFSLCTKAFLHSMNGALMCNTLRGALDGYHFRGKLAEPSLFAVLNEVDSEYLAFLARHPHAMQGIAWQAFEKITREIFKSYGYDIRYVGNKRGASADYLIVHKDQEGKSSSYMIECKRYSNRLGLDIVQNILGACTLNSHSGAMLVTTSSFTKDVEDQRQRFRQLKLELRSGDEVIEWLRFRYGDTSRSSRKAPADPHNLWLLPGMDRHTS